MRITVIKFIKRHLVTITTYIITASTIQVSVQLSAVNKKAVENYHPEKHINLYLLILIGSSFPRFPLVVFFGKPKEYT
ncbi:hypothetical protein [Vibrio breoganii]|uniref:hypothetical protein n=1 Tax=Vibrio breoganii TaxID=553239 RepID=UPI0010547A35|nr:hypothetical protein [Vibrio breoganii]